MRTEALLEVRGLSKTYPGVRALAGVDLVVGVGEVHALLGENGAGKSTLLRILAGLERPDAGRVRWQGRDVRIRDVRHASALGIAMIHQEPMSFRELSVAENIFMGHEPVRGPLHRIDRARMRSDAAALLGRLGSALDPGCRMGDLGVAEMQLVEIAKALARRARLIIMDEPTSALCEREAQALFAVVDELRTRGVAVLYVSHRLREIFRLAGVATVLRDGRRVAGLPVAGLDEARLIALMVGRAPSASETERAPAVGVRGSEVLSVRGLGRRRAFAGVSFDLRAGEILGLAGLMGAGRTALLHALAGLAPADCGEVRIDGRRVRIGSPRAARANGIAWAGEDRMALGLIPGMSVGENLTLGLLDRFCVGPWIDRARERKAIDALIDAFGIRVADPDVAVRTLSGGNQQKVVLARASLTGPRVLLLDEPTRGIDVGAKAEVCAIVRRLARDGLAVLMVSSELPEVMAWSDRLLVMRAGEVRAELDPRALEPEEVMRHAFWGGEEEVS